MESVLYRLSRCLGTNILRNIRKTNNKIYKQESPGWLYILEHPYESMMYKVGRTKNDPFVRAKNWGYKLLWYNFTETNIRSEKIAHLYLSSFHKVIPAINGTGKTEIEWFNIQLDFLQCVLTNILIKENICNYTRKPCNYVDKIKTYNINKLKKIYGIGDVLSNRLYNYILNINEIDELLNVKGIGEKRLLSIIYYI